MNDVESEPLKFTPFELKIIKDYLSSHLYSPKETLVAKL